MRRWIRSCQNHPYPSDHSPWVICAKSGRFAGFWQGGLWHGCLSCLAVPRRCMPPANQIWQRALGLVILPLVRCGLFRRFRQWAICKNCRWVLNFVWHPAGKSIGAPPVRPDYRQRLICKWRMVRRCKARSNGQCQNGLTPLALIILVMLMR